jgi:hypothetical protein
MKLSLVIPTTPNHFRFLDCILKNYELGTEKPDEVIISVSNSNFINPIDIQNLETKYFKSFESLKIIKNEFILLEGPNRGNGSKFAENELISYHDSDDIPHPQRIEIIKYFFKNFDILHLNHSFQYETEFKNINLKDIKFVGFDELYDLHFSGITNVNERDQNIKHSSYSGMLDFWICGGPTTIKREVLKHIEWNENRIISYDYDFCMDVLYKFKKSMSIDSKLIWYNKVKGFETFCKD